MQIIGDNRGGTYRQIKKDGDFFYATVDGTTWERIDNADGKSAYEVWLENHTGTADDFFESLRGPRGFTGAQGVQGEQGIQGIQGATGEKGDKGDKGDQGDQGIQGVQGETGAKGEKGDKGDQGNPGSNGTNGTNGAAGADGKSVYQSWLDEGHTGTEAEFLAALKGDAATIQVGTVVSLPQGYAPTVTNSGTGYAAILNFGFPEGTVSSGGSGGATFSGSEILLEYGNRFQGNTTLTYGRRF